MLEKLREADKHLDFNEKRGSVNTKRSQEKYNMEVGDSTKPGAQLGVDYFVFPMYTTAVESTAYEEDK